MGIVFFIISYRRQRKNKMDNRVGYKIIILRNLKEYFIRDVIFKFILQMSNVKKKVTLILSSIQVTGVFTSRSKRQVSLTQEKTVHNTI